MSLCDLMFIKDAKVEKKHFRKVYLFYDKDKNMELFT